MSGFNNSETVLVTFDPVSINACKKTGFIAGILFEAAWYWTRSASYAKFASKLYATSADTLENCPIWILCIVGEMIKDERKLNNCDISNTPVLCDGWKLLNLSPHHSSVVCSELKFCEQSLIITCNNLSFMNCIPQCETIYCVFRFMCPPQPSLSPATARVLRVAVRHVWISSILRLFITYLTARYHLDPLLRLFCIFQTPHGWCGRAPYNRAGGWGYLNALVLLQRGGEKALTQWKVVILYLLQPYSYSTLLTSHIKPLQYKSLWTLNLFSLGLDS